MNSPEEKNCLDYSSSDILGLYIKCFIDYIDKLKAVECNSSNYSSATKKYIQCFKDYVEVKCGK